MHIRPKAFTKVVANSTLSGNSPKHDIPHFLKKFATIKHSLRQRFLELKYDCIRIWDNIQRQPY